MDPLPNIVGCDVDHHPVSPCSDRVHQQWLERLAGLLPAVQWLALIRFTELEGNARITAIAPTTAKPLIPSGASDVARQAATRRQVLALQIDAGGDCMLAFSLHDTDCVTADGSLATRASDGLALDSKPGSIPTVRMNATQDVLLVGHADLPEAQRKTLIRLSHWAAQWLPSTPPASNSLSKDASKSPDAPSSNADCVQPEATRSDTGNASDGIAARLIELCCRYRTSSEAALALVNLLHSRFDCVRVSLGRAKHQRPDSDSADSVTICAVSGQSLVDTRRTLARQLGAAMVEALTQRTTVLHDDSNNVSAQAERSTRPAHVRLCAEQGQHVIVSIPLIDEFQGATVLLLEWPEARRSSLASMQSLARTLAPLPSLLALLDDASAGPVRRFRRLLTAPALRSGNMDPSRQAPMVGATDANAGSDQPWWSRARLAPGSELRKPGWRTAVVVVIALLTLGSVLPMTHQVSARAIIEAADRQVIIAPYPGFVRSAHARAGEPVKAGQLLATLDDSQLLLEADKWRAEQLKNDQESASALALHDRTELRRLRADAGRIDAELSLIESRIERSELRAPFDGVLISGDLSQSLGAPVEAGTVLFEIASADRYTLLLDVEDRDMGAIDSGQAVNVRLTALPERDWHATLDALLPVAVPDQGNSVFRLPATFTGSAAALRPGMEGVGKIQASRQTILWVLLHPLIDRLRLIGWRLGLL